MRVLWTMKGAEAGPLEGKWNGKDDEGKAVSRGEYTWKVIVNRSKYENIGTIGNTGQPPTTSGHVPVYLAGVAVDSTNGVYTVQDWDEPHFSVIKWSANDGRAEFNTDNVVNEALLRVITVEPDGSYAYVTGYEDLSDRAKAKFSIWRLKLAPGKGNSKVEDFSKAGRKIRVYDGNAQFPENASVEDREVMNIPLRSLAILGSTLYATDALKGRVLLYDKESGELKKEFPVPLACGIALDPNGRIWVGHEHEKVSVLSADGKVLATPITDLKDVWALALRGDKLYVADREQGQVRIYQVKGNDVVLDKTFGEAGRPGDRAPERFTSIEGMAVDRHGNIIIVDRAGEGLVCKSSRRNSSGFGTSWAWNFPRKEPTAKTIPTRSLPLTRTHIAWTRRLETGIFSAPPERTRPRSILEISTARTGDRHVSCASANKISSTSRRGRRGSLPH